MLIFSDKPKSPAGEALECDEYLLANVIEGGYAGCVLGSQNSKQGKTPSDFLVGKHAGFLYDAHLLKGINCVIASDSSVPAFNTRYIKP